MTEFSRIEIYMLMNSAKPLWLSEIDLSEADLRGANLAWAVLTNADLHKLSSLDAL